MSRRNLPWEIPLTTPLLFDIVLSEEADISMKLEVEGEADHQSSRYYFTVENKGGSIILKATNSNLITNVYLCDEKHKDLTSRLPAYKSNDLVVVSPTYYEEDWCDIYIDGDSIKMNFKPFEDGMNPVLKRIELLALPVFIDGKILRS